MRARSSTRSVLLGLAILLGVGATPALALESKMVHIVGSGISPKLALLGNSNMVGSFDTCFENSTSLSSGETVVVEVAFPNGAGGWQPAVQHTFLMSTSGTQNVAETTIDNTNYFVKVTVTLDDSCSGALTWRIVFSQSTTSNPVVN